MWHLSWLVSRFETSPGKTAIVAIIIIGSNHLLIFTTPSSVYRSIRSSDSSDRRVLHGLWPVPDCSHTNRGRGSQRRHLLGIQSQPSGHIATVRRNTDESHQLSGQLGRSAGPDRRRLRYWQKGKWKIVLLITITELFVLYYDCEQNNN